jgi:phytol kinase
LAFLLGFGTLILYFVCGAGALLAVRHFTTIPRELFRKMLHILLLGSVLIFVYAFDSWQHSAAAAVTFMAVVYPVLAIGERITDFSELLIERKPGEIKRSLIAVFSTFGVLIWICWGELGQRYLVLASVFGWGLGDAAAALVGQRFGRHFIEGKWVEGRKSMEGSLAMFGASFVGILAVLHLTGPANWSVHLPVAVLAAAVCALVELYTKNGMDTVTCPLAAAAMMIMLFRLWGV